ncbi:MAG TPA: alpha/beta fold hydrolase [Nitrososphaera sp.]|nr:alpha/beta fold hydrolase [Nitrososphaera sp.]
MRKQNSILALALLLGLIVLSSAAQRSIEGHWEGVMVREGAELPVSFDFTNEAGRLAASFNSPNQRAMGIPLRKVSYIAPKVHFELVGDATTNIFDGELNADTIAGEFREGDARGTFSIRRVDAKPPTFKQEEVSFRNGDVTLSGTLLLPLTEVPHPAVVFLHGAGSEGRYGARFLAEYFTRYDIAALIYDKRGVGKSTGDWKRSDFTDLAGDAIAGIHFLQQRKEINPRRIGIYGHSQGGSIAPLVAARSKDVAFVISGAGGGVPMYEAEINSLTNQIRTKGITGGDLAEATAFIQIFIRVARTGEGWAQLDTAIEKARDTKWLPIVRPPAKDNYFWSFYKQIADYNPAVYWEKVSVPVLIIQAERDIYVPVASSVANIDRALRKAGNKDYTILILPRALHTFNINPEPGQPFEWWHVAPGFPDLLTAWINQRMKG